MTEGQVRVAIEVLRAYHRGDLADDQTIGDPLYEELACAIEDAYEQVQVSAPPMAVSA